MLKRTIFVAGLLGLLGCSRDSSVFISEFLKDPTSVGAVVPCCEETSVAMVEPLIKGDGFVLELGGGTGAFTQKLIEKIDHDKLFVVENNKAFFDLLVKKFPDHKILFADAQELEKHLPVHVHGKIKYVVSGLPFRSLPDDVASNILKSLKKVCAPDVVIVQFTYLKQAPLPEEALSLFDFKPDFYKHIPENFPSADIWIYKK